MSGDCPHHQQLQTTIQQYEKQAQILATTHADYLHIVGELKDELDTLSCQVTSIMENTNKLSSSMTGAASSEQNQLENLAPAKVAFTNDCEDNLVRAMHALEQQNDLLQSALHYAGRNHDDYCFELVEQNAYLKAHLQTMYLALAEKEKVITEQNVSLARYTAPKISIGVDVDSLVSSHSQLKDANKRVESLERELDRSRSTEQYLLRETRQLNEQLIESKQKTGELRNHVERLRTLLKDRTDNYEVLAKNYEALSKSGDNQTKQIFDLQQKMAELEKTSAQDKMETKLLQHQIATLRQKDASTAGELKALHERNIKLEKELTHANEVFKNLQNVMRQKDEVHTTSMKKQQEANAELENFLKKTQDQLDELKKEQEELRSFCTQQNKTIESYSKWKALQHKSEKETQESISRYEYHLKLLREQNVSCLERCRCLYENNQYLNEEVKRLRASTLSTKPGTPTPMESEYNHPLLIRLDQLRHTTRRVVQQEIHLKNGTTINSKRVDPFSPAEITNSQPSHDPPRLKSSAEKKFTTAALNDGPSK